MRVFFDEAQAANKRNSLLLIAFVIILAFLMVYFITWYLRLGTSGILLAAFFAIAYPLFSYYASDSIVLASSGAKPADGQQYRQFHNVVEAICIAANQPKPRVYVITDPSPNAFATGRDPQHASIAATTGLLSMMGRQELEGVVAHELSHIKNYDIRFMTLTVALIGMISIMADIFLRMFMFGGRGNRDRTPPIFMLVGLALIILSPIVAQVIKFAISRQREYLADATAAELTRYPVGLASALKKIKEANLPTKTAAQAAASLYISDPFVNKLANIFSTHPPIDERIKRLEAM